jgi:hypothetical protein
MGRCKSGKSKAGSIETGISKEPPEANIDRLRVEDLDKASGRGNNIKFEY